MKMLPFPTVQAQNQKNAKVPHLQFRSDSGAHVRYAKSSLSVALQFDEVWSRRLVLSTGWFLLVRLLNTCQVWIVDTSLNFY